MFPPDDLYKLLLLPRRYDRSLMHRPFQNHANGHVALSAFTDVMLAIVPIAAFWRLQLRTMTKIGLCLLMGTTMLYVTLNLTWPDGK